MTRGYLIDTNHIGSAVTRGSPARRRIAELQRRGARIGTCVPVLCEVEVGGRQVKDRAEYRAALEHLIRQLRIWPIEVSTARIYGAIYEELRRRGRVLSQVDMMLASLAREMNLTLVTTDNDFAALPDIPTENWLKP